MRAIMSVSGWAHWGNWAKLFVNNKGVAAHGTDICMNYPPNDPSVWNW